VKPIEEKSLEELKRELELREALHEGAKHLIGYMRGTDTRTFEEVVNTFLKSKGIEP